MSQNPSNPVGSRGEYRKRDHCRKGHRFTERNTGFARTQGYTVRVCRQCRSAFDRLRYQRNAERRAAMRKLALAKYYAENPVGSCRKYHRKSDAEKAAGV